MAPIDRAEFAQACVTQGVYLGANPHYMLGVAQLRSGISDDSDGNKIGPFRLTQDEWNANCNDDDFDIHFSPTGINEWPRQTFVFGLMAQRAFATFVANKGQNPSALELYLQQWPEAASATLQADLQQALDATAPLIDPAAQAVLDDPATVPSIITDPNTPGKQAGPVPAGPVPKKLVKLRDANQNRWMNMQITRGLTEINNTATRLVAPAAKARYQGVSATTGVPWFIIAVIHEREASQKWSANIAQGDPWNQRSVNVPAGRGPFNSWEEAAVDALVNCDPKAAKWQDWSAGGALTLLELYNGLGYYFRDLPSPYNWASTNQYVKGKFTGDHRFDPNFVDPQIGCAALLSRMKTLDASINI
jgi:lysozyme family protein